MEKRKLLFIVPLLLIVTVSGCLQQNANQDILIGRAIDTYACTRTDGSQFTGAMLNDPQLGEQASDIRATSHFGAATCKIMERASMNTQDYVTMCNDKIAYICDALPQH